jgi:pimeloyl-ACP methyl ester carboxylesterase
VSILSSWKLFDNSMSGLIDQAVAAVIRPRRYQYDPDSLSSFFSASDDEDPVYMRHSLRLQNSRHQTIIGSLYYHTNFNVMECGRCLMYLHGNASCQLEGQFLVPNFCPHGVLVACIDFAGCGGSDGEYISLGLWEKDDVELVMSRLAVMFGISQFFLWGRSMGAATAVMVRSPYLKGIIVDSAYTSVIDLCTCIAGTQSPLPGWLTPSAVWVLAKLVKGAAGFDIYDVRPVDSVSSAKVPALFGHAPDDEFVPFPQGRELFEKYDYGDKLFFAIDGGTHNSRRPESWVRLGVCFALQRMGIRADDNTPICTARRLQGGDFHFVSFAALLGSTQAEGPVDTETEEPVVETRKAVVVEREEAVVVETQEPVAVETGEAVAVAVETEEPVARGEC